MTSSTRAPNAGRAGRAASRPTARLAFRIGEAAAVIGVGRTTFWRMMRAGELPVVTIDGVRRILRRDLEAWLEAHKG